MRSSSSPRGIILLIVLGILALMSVLAISFVQVSKLEKSIARGYVDRTRASLAAESGVEYAISRIYEFRGGALSRDELESIEYRQGVTPDLEYMQRASFQVVGEASPVSGFVGGSYVENGDYYILKVDQASSRIHLNDSNGKWNMDDDPVADDAAADPDLLNAPRRLTSILEALGTQLFGDVTGGALGLALMDARAALPGDRFSDKGQVRSALVPDILTPEEYDVFEPYFTLHAWQDPNVLRPTFQLNISAPDFFPQPEDMFNVYLYSDFQTSYFELEPRSPINVNTAPKALLQALIQPVRGWYLYEGEPASLMDGTCGPWIKSLRTTGFTHRDTLRKNFEPRYYLAPLYMWHGPTPKTTAKFGNATRYGEARLTRPVDDSLAAALSAALWSRVHEGLDLNGDGTVDSTDAPSNPERSRPFTTWDEFTRFLYELVDPEADVLEGDVSGNPDTTYQGDLTPQEEAARFPYRVAASGECFYAEAAKSVATGYSVLRIPGFDRYQADALLANFNPNALLNDVNPDFSLFRHIDKSQLTQYTTELCFQPDGFFTIESLGVVKDQHGAVVGKSGILTTMKLFHTLRLTTQSQFMGEAGNGYDPETPESLYDLFWESEGSVPTANCDLTMGAATGGRIEAGGRWGPTLCSYPEPLRNTPSLSVGENPYWQDDAKPSWMSRYEGYIMLSTLQRDFDSYLSLVDRGNERLFNPAGNNTPLNAYPAPDRIRIPSTSEPPCFMATMGYRKLTDKQREHWRNTSLAVGGMLPVRFGNNEEKNYLDWDRHATPPAALTVGEKVASDEIVGIGPDGLSPVKDGRGQMLVWKNDYTATPGDAEAWWDINCHLRKFHHPLPTVMAHDTPWDLQQSWNYIWISHVSHSQMPDLWWPTCAGNLGSFHPQEGINWATVAANGGTVSIAQHGDPFRIGWNLPSDAPVTPDARDDSGPVKQVQGNLFPDGAFSEQGRLLSYPATNLGSDWGTQGAICFWLKPHFDVGYSNRPRQFFSMGHMGPAYTHALDLLYWPVGRRADGSGPVEDGSVGCLSLPLNRTVGEAWPLPPCSLWFGWFGTSHEQMVWNFSNGDSSINPMYRLGTTQWDDGGHVAVATTVTDFFPRRTSGARGTGSYSYGFYGHQWNLVGMSYLNHSLGSSIAPAADVVELTVNGLPMNAPSAGALNTHGYSETKYTESPHPSIQANRHQHDFYWQENPNYHFAWYDPDVNPSDDYIYKYKPEPKHNHIGSGYMRFGWCEENGGPVGDATYDEIIAWKHPVAGSVFEELWEDGRYSSEAVATFDPAGGTGPAEGKVLGLYTSPGLDLWNALKGSAKDPFFAKRLRIHSASWTLYWPRYNWRPGPGSDDDWRNWPTRAGGLQGFDAELAGAAEEADPVTGMWDPILFDYSKPDGVWRYSGDVDGAAPFENLETLAAHAGGSHLYDPGVEYKRGDLLRFRLYFVAGTESPLYESPVLDDVTLTFVGDSPSILSWQVIS